MGKDTWSYIEYWERGTLDQEWIPLAASEGWSVVTSDKLRPHRRLALRQHVGRVFLISSKDISPWEQFRLLVNKWDELERWAKKERPPYIVRVPKRGKLQEVVV